jgi:hypothetical protein
MRGSEVGLIVPVVIEAAISGAGVYFWSAGLRVGERSMTSGIPVPHPPLVFLGLGGRC